MAAQIAVVQLCDVCDSEDNVRWYCKDCHEVMCESCKSVHLRSRKTKNDDVIPLSEARDIQKIPAIWCDLHSSEEVRYNCQQCDKLICITCLHEKHNGHKWISLDDFRNTASKQLEDVKEKFSSRLLSGQRVLDIERDIFAKKSSHFEKIKTDAKNQSKQIIHKVKKFRDETLRSVSETHQKELDRHKEITDSITRENAEVQSIMIKLVSFRENENPSVGMKYVKAATRALTQLGEQCQPSSTVLPTFQSGVIDSHALQLMLGTFMLNVKPVKHDGVIDKSKLTVVSKVTVGPSGKSGCVKNIIPDKNGNFWVSTSGDDYFTLIKKDGTVVGRSEKFGGVIKDAVAFNDNILVTQEGEKSKVMKISPVQGISTFSKHHPYITGALCVTSDELDVLVYIYKLAKKDGARIIRLGTDAVVKATIQLPVHITDACRIACLHSGEILVACFFNDKKVVRIDSNGSHLCDYNMKIDGNVSNNKCITKDSYNNVFVTDSYNNRVLFIRPDGKVKCLLDQSTGLKTPYAIVVPRDGQLMIGCDAGRIICVEY